MSTNYVRTSRYEDDGKPKHKSKANDDIAKRVTARLGGGKVKSQVKPQPKQMDEHTEFMTAIRNHLQPAHEINQRNRREMAQSQAQAVKERIEGLEGEDKQEAQANLQRILAMPLHSILTPDTEDEGFDNNYLLARYREQSTLLKSFVESLYPNHN